MESAKRSYLLFPSRSLSIIIRKNVIDSRTYLCELTILWVHLTYTWKLDVKDPFFHTIIPNVPEMMESGICSFDLSVFFIIEWLGWLVIASIK